MSQDRLKDHLGQLLSAAPASDLPAGVEMGRVPASIAVELVDAEPGDSDG